ncbi:MAG TPA: FAD-dependent thymidylate synthase [Ktedonobacterales bacterium]|jgi:thymidylate synthase ThyX
MNIYAVIGAPPEIQAYALAKYSRSAQQLSESIDELSTQRAEQFLNTFYFQYGHRSIADLAHVALAIENISMLAAFHVVDEPLWDGQERSSRYQDFRKSGFYIPPQLPEDAPERATYARALDALLDRYEYFSTELTDVLKQVQPCPDDMAPGVYNRTLRARAFDVARAFLPLATRTSVGQITSARVLEQQISRLTGHSSAELRDIGEAIRQACQTPAHNFIESKLRAAWEAAALSPEQIEQQQRALEEAGILGLSAAPTLVKYTTPEVYGPRALAEARARLEPYLHAQPAAPDLSAGIALIEPETDLLEAYAASLLYLTDHQGRAYRQLQPLARALPEEEKRALFTHTLAQRGPHDDWLRLHRLGYLLAFDLLVDFGALRDLHRHRRCVQIIPDLKLHLGFDDPTTIFHAGLGPDGAALAEQKGLISAYRQAMQQAIAAAQAFPLPEYAPYLLPLGVRQRALFKMDLAEAAYIIELRSGVTGHFSYRRVAYDMYRQLSQRHPYLAPVIRATNPDEVVDLLKR